MRILSSVTATSDQLRIVGDSGPGFRLVRGAAGSGKTTTALLRLRQLCRSRVARRARLGLSDPVRVLVLTYNRTLEGYIAELARQQVGGGPGLVLEVSTFSRWARSIVADVDILDRDQAAKLLRPTLLPFASSTSHMDFLIDEVEYALGRFLPHQLDGYLTARREGRGATPRVGRALRDQLLADVIRPYQQAKDIRGVGDWNDLALMTINEPSANYDVVIVDEAQDFSANQVRAVLAHLAPDHSTTFVMDAMQRIYPRYFAWAEVGITVRAADTWRLKRNYRNTAEIAAFARPLVEDLPAEDDGTLPDFSSCVASGKRPRVIAGKYSGQIDYMLDWVINEVDLTTESVAILQPRGGGWFDYARTALKRRRIPYCELTRVSEWPTGPEAFALSTIHSAKGLEFDHVLIPGLSQQVTPHGDDEGDASLDRLRRLLAMGVGRARRSVMIGYKPGEESSLIKALDPDSYDLVIL